MMFVRLHETNDWEGEEWDWWLQLTGNETELGKFAEMLAAIERKEKYELPFQFFPQDIESEAVVDKLVEYAAPGYCDSANKVAGTFTCPDDLGAGAEYLYKGGIHSFFFFKETNV